MKNKYCNVCGTEFRRGRIKEKKSEPSMKKALRSKKKIIISLLSVLIIIGVALPVTLIWVSQRPHYEGKLTITSVNIIPLDQSKEQLEVVLEVEHGIVFVKQLELFSLVGHDYYGSFPITSFELEENEVRVVSFIFSKNDPLFSEGFGLKIIHKFKVQWFTYAF